MLDQESNDKPVVLKQFQATYGKPLLAARDPKCSAKDAEAGALAMEALHKQVCNSSFILLFFINRHLVVVLYPTISLDFPPIGYAFPLTTNKR